MLLASTLRPLISSGMGVLAMCSNDFWLPVSRWKPAHCSWTPCVLITFTCVLLFVVGRVQYSSLISTSNIGLNRTLRYPFPWSRRSHGHLSKYLLTTRLPAMLRPRCCLRLRLRVRARVYPLHSPGPMNVATPTPRYLFQWCLGVRSHTIEV